MRRAKGTVVIVPLPTLRWLVIAPRATSALTRDCAAANLCVGSFSGDEIAPLFAKRRPTHDIPSFRSRHRLRGERPRPSGVQINTEDRSARHRDGGPGSRSRCESWRLAYLQPNSGRRSVLATV